MPGPLPKPADQRVRKQKDHIPLKLVHYTPTPQPDLPDIADWHPQVLKSWEIWGNSALATEFTDIEWQYLIETMFLLNEFWNGDTKVANELRMRGAKFGVTPEDRARLRIQIVCADEAEDKAKARVSVPVSRDRYRQPPKVG